MVSGISSQYYASKRSSMLCGLLAMDLMLRFGYHNLGGGCVGLTSCACNVVF